MFKIKNIFILAIISVFTLNTSLASEVNSTTESTTANSNFVLESVVATDLNTIKATFNNELAPQVDGFSFMLIKKDDAISDIYLTGVTLSGPKELTMKTEVPLDDKFGYNFAILVVSDKNGNSIETGVDSTIDLVFQLGNNSTSTTENISLVGNTNEVMNSAGENNVNGEVTQISAEMSVTNETANLATTPVEEVATTENMTKVETGPTETIAVILALLAGLAFVYFRRKA